ncbi:hypothetical protein ACRQ1B_07755 [Rhizobium panacihumi]|uniref:hypothetical protein n=1 Tax=Rhizobium panacihumi TaxID=2008450 RepID=UPI003D79E6C6
MSGSSIFKTRIGLSVSLTLVALAVTGCSLTSKKPEVAAIEQGPRPKSAAEAMQRVENSRQVANDAGRSKAFVDPLVSARPGQSVRDFRASGRTAAAAMRSNTAPAAETAQPQNTAASPATLETAQSAMAGVVTQPTGIQAGRNSIFSANAAPATDLGAGVAESPAAASRVSSATGSLSADAVAYAPVRRISGTTGGLFAGGPQLAASADSNAPAEPATSHAPPGISTRPSVPAAAQPVAQGLW